MCRAQKAKSKQENLKRKKTNEPLLLQMYQYIPPPVIISRHLPCFPAW